jgi:hypothetical protein
VDVYSVGIFIFENFPQGPSADEGIAVHYHDLGMQSFGRREELSVASLLAGRAESIPDRVRPFTDLGFAYDRPDTPHIPS